jgi:acyl-CoA thioesterase YciA
MTDFSDREPSLRTVAMPADTNPAGDIFGGWLVGQMDLAGSTLATRVSDGRTATVAIDQMTFHRPVYVGDEVSCYTELENVGNTSMTINVVSMVRRQKEESPVKVTEGVFTYVALDENGEPRPVKS